MLLLMIFLLEICNDQTGRECEDRKAFWWFYWTCSTMSQMLMESVYIQLYSIFCSVIILELFPISNISLHFYNISHCYDFQKSVLYISLKDTAISCPVSLLNVFLSSLWASSKLFSRFWLLVHIWIYITLQPDLWHKKQFQFGEV